MIEVDSEAVLEHREPLGLGPLRLPKQNLKKNVYLLKVNLNYSLKASVIL